MEAQRSPKRSDCANRKIPNMNSALKKTFYTVKYKSKSMGFNFVDQILNSRNIKQPRKEIGCCATRKCCLHRLLRRTLALKVFKKTYPAHYHIPSSTAIFWNPHNTTRHSNYIRYQKNAASLGSLAGASTWTRLPRMKVIRKTAAKRSANTDLF